jgi:hypothetical protein
MKADQSPEMSLVDLLFKQASLEENPHGWQGRSIAICPVMLSEMNRTLSRSG